MLGGIIWMLLLPLNEYSRQTYISENALLPGQVHTYFGGSEQNVFRAYKQELGYVLSPHVVYVDGVPQSDAPVYAPEAERNARIQELFKNAGLKTARQRYTYTSSGQNYSGENVYAVLNAPRGDGTEAIVLSAAIRHTDDAINLKGLTLLISLARYFKRWSLWSKDIIFLVTPDSIAGPQAWIDAYHSTHDPRTVQDLTLKSGALQGAVCIDYPFEHSFEAFHISYDGVNGQLPNLDLFNTAVSIASGQMGVGNSIQFQHLYTQHNTQHLYKSRLSTLVRGMASQALGHATGPHSVFMPYHIDAITLSAVGTGWQDEMAFGRTVESICRSLNNLLEKLHQSFFFYLLMQSNRFVSIGTYLPSAMAIAGSYSIMAIFLWVKSGYEVAEDKSLSTGTTNLDEKVIDLDDKTDDEIAAILGISNAPAAPVPMSEPIDRDLTLPIGLLTTVHLTSLIPLYLLNTLALGVLPQTFLFLALFSLVVPIILASALPQASYNTSLPALKASTTSQHILIKSLSMLLLGLFLTVLATLNFSLSMFLGLLCSPLAFVDRTSNKYLAALQYMLLVLMSPMGAAAGFGGYAYYVMGKSDLLGEFLGKVAFGWNVWGSWGIGVGVLCIWWPAWVVQAMLVASSWFDDGRQVNTDKTASGKSDTGRSGTKKGLEPGSSTRRDRMEFDAPKSSRT